MKTLFGILVFVCLNSLQAQHPALKVNGGITSAIQSIQVLNEQHAIVNAEEGMLIYDLQAGKVAAKLISNGQPPLYSCWILHHPSSPFFYTVHWKKPRTFDLIIRGHQLTYHLLKWSVADFRIIDTINLPQEVDAPLNPNMPFRLLNDSTLLCFKADKARNLLLVPMITNIRNGRIINEFSLDGSVRKELEKQVNVQRSFFFRQVARASQNKTGYQLSAHADTILVTYHHNEGHQRVCWVMNKKKNVADEVSSINLSASDDKRYIVNSTGYITDQKTQHRLAVIPDTRKFAWTGPASFAWVLNDKLLHTRIAVDGTAKTDTCLTRPSFARVAVALHPYDNGRRIIVATLRSLIQFDLHSHKTIFYNTVTNSRDVATYRMMFPLWNRMNAGQPNPFAWRMQERADQVNLYSMPGNKLVSQRNPFLDIFGPGHASDSIRNRFPIYEHHASYLLNSKGLFLFMLRADAAFVTGTRGSSADFDAFYYVVSAHDSSFYRYYHVDSKLTDREIESVSFDSAHNRLVCIGRKNEMGSPVVFALNLQQSNSIDTLNYPRQGEFTKVKSAFTPSEFYSAPLSNQRFLVYNRILSAMHIWSYNEGSTTPAGNLADSFDFYFGGNLVDARNQNMLLYASPREGAMSKQKLTLFDLHSFRSIGSFNKTRPSEFALHSENFQFFLGERFLVSRFLDEYHFYSTPHGVYGDSSQPLFTFYPVNDSDWVVMTPAGLFDASAGAMSQMYFVQGLNIIDLSQLKERYYEPGLAAKLLGLNHEPLRHADNLAHLSLYPKTAVSLKDSAGSTFLYVSLTNQGGGIGRTSVFMNGKEAKADLRPERFNKQAATARFIVDVNEIPYFVCGRENRIEVKAWNADEYIESRGAVVRYECKNEPAPEKPNLYLLCVGVSDYTGNDIDLRYPAKDATDLGRAVQLGGQHLFGADQVKVFSLTSETKDNRPLKKNIQNAFAQIKQNSRPSDILVVYFAGHGINLGGSEGDFYFLTEEAYTASPAVLNEPQLRAACSIGSHELTDLIKSVPALKQLLIIDACGSGKAIDNLVSKRDVESGTLRALERMKDRTGMHIITGCAADAVSYEATRYGQGLLTYSLLEGLKGAALREGKFADVNLLFQHARERVPQLALGIGGIQEPKIFSPYGAESFDVGEFSAESRTAIPLAQAKPMFIRSNFLDIDQSEDVLNLGTITDNFLIESAGRGINANMVFIDVKDFPDAYKLTGTYRQAGKLVTLRLKIKSRNLEKKVELKARNAEELKQQIVDEIGKTIRP